MRVWMCASMLFVLIDDVLKTLYSLLHVLHTTADGSEFSAGALALSSFRYEGIMFDLVRVISMMFIRMGILLLVMLGSMMHILLMMLLVGWMMGV